MTHSKLRAKALSNSKAKAAYDELITEFAMLRSGSGVKPLLLLDWSLRWAMENTRLQLRRFKNIPMRLAVNYNLNLSGLQRKMV